MKTPHQIDDYFFDLQGYLVFHGALAPDHVLRLNTEIDAIPRIAPGEWHGGIFSLPGNAGHGINYQNIYEAGPAFEELIDHPAWIGHVRRYCDDWGCGVFIDECFANLRDPGEAIQIHSGGHERITRTQFRYHDGKFHCGQVNVLVALTDIGPGDGATMVIPGSHKSNLPHPELAKGIDGYMEREGQSADGVAGAIEVQMKAGDALLFPDCLAHGSARRVNTGQRRIVVYRYSVGWARARFGLQPSRQFVARLTPERRAVVTGPWWPPQVSPPERMATVL